MKIELIVAVSKDNVIGVNGKLPWPRVTADMKHFQEHTRWKTLIMGRTTWQSLPTEKGYAPHLSQRDIVVVSSTSLGGLVQPFGAGDVPRGFYEPAFRSRVYAAPDLFRAVARAATIPEGAQDIVIAGGLKLYEAFLPIADTVRLTRIHTDVALKPGDNAVYWPCALDDVLLDNFQIVETVKPPKMEGELRCTIETWFRKGTP